MSQFSEAVLKFSLIFKGIIDFFCKIIYLSDWNQFTLVSNFFSFYFILKKNKRGNKKVEKIRILRIQNKQQNIKLS